MRIKWQSDPQDIKKVKVIIQSQCQNPQVKERHIRNVELKKPVFNKNRFWKTMILCLLSSQQRSGPDSPINRFNKRRPYPLSLRVCESHAGNLDGFVERILTENGGIRRNTIIGNEVAHNYSWLNDKGWKEIKKISAELSSFRTHRPDPEAISVERKAARFIAGNLKGFGPKQARNLWQTLGLSRYEIPLDSRLTKWLNSNRIFPFTLSAASLQDRNYYEWVMDGIQELCLKCNVLPCILDASIFSSFDSKR